MFLLSPSIQNPLFRAVMVLSLMTVAGIGVVQAKSPNGRSAGFGIVKGIVRDTGGKPIIGALISIFNADSLELFKQIKSASDGTFNTRLIPGKYTIIAAANGFDSAGFSSVEVTRSSELVYKFKLQQSGLGKTVPEKRPDRKNSMWVIRSSQIRRSIYQHREGEQPAQEDTAIVEDAESVKTRRSSQSVFESYFGSSGGLDFRGVNFATFKPLSDTSEMIVAGQYGSEFAPMRIETELRSRPNTDHQVRLGLSLAQFSGPGVRRGSGLGQISFQATDEWRARNSVIIVLGVDYSRFLGSGKDFVLSPRLGLQFDADSKTRIRTSYTTQTEDRNTQGSIDFEGATVSFREPTSIREVVVVNGRPLMNRSSRLEFGVERVIDSRSSVEANLFVDLTASRGVGLVNIPINFLSDEGQEFIANQQGRTQGLRVVYSRRLNARMSTSAGYAFGKGQRLTTETSVPGNLFETDGFQTFFGQFGAEVLSGTNVRTVFRLSPKATIFAIDPFQGRLAIYDPSLSILVTQILPSMGLPIRAEAILDARNLLDYQAGANGDEGTIRLLSQKRVLRGGIKLRF